MSRITLRQLAAIVHLQQEQEENGLATTFPGAAHTYLSLCRRGLAEFTNHEGGSFALTDKGAKIAHRITDLTEE